MDSGYQEMDSGHQEMDSGYQEMDSGYQYVEEKAKNEGPKHIFSKLDFWEIFSFHFNV